MLQWPWLPGAGDRAGTGMQKWFPDPLALVCHSAAGSSCLCLLAPSFCPIASELKINPYTHMQRRIPQGAAVVGAGRVLQRGRPHTRWGHGSAVGRHGSAPELWSGNKCL